MCSPANRESGLRIAYSPFHGVGGKFTPRFLRALGFEHVFEVPEQMKPDPDFPTVPFPNPEEGAAVLVSHLQLFVHNLFSNFVEMLYGNRQQEQLPCDSGQ